MGRLIFDGDDMRGLYGVMLDALAEKRRTGMNPEIVVNGKRIAPYDLVKIAQMTPDAPLSDEDQARSPFQKKQKSYKFAVYNIANRINSISADLRAQQTAAATLARMTEETASSQTVDRSKPAGDGPTTSPVPTLPKIIERMRALADFHTVKTNIGRELADLIRDLEALPQESTSVRQPDPTLDDVLKADPSRSDRDIARQMKCSPTTVGNARVRLGLNVGERSVQRGGQIYKMKRRSAMTS